MDNWRKNRWTIYYGITWVFFVAKAISIIPWMINSTELYSFTRPATLPLKIVAMLITFSLFQVLRYFRESPYILSSVYIVLANDVFFLLVGDKLLSLAMLSFVSLPIALYYIICLFFVKAPEVSAHFRRLAIVDIALLVAAYFYWLYAVLHWPYPMAIYRIRLLLQIAPYIAILPILQTMRKLTSDYATSIEKDIANIGEPIGDR